MRGSVDKDTLMGLISGAVACTRFNVIALPDEIEFDLVPFRAIAPGSVIREREGIVPFEPEEPYEIGARRWAFRVRMDKVNLDSTLIAERLKELIKVETENVGPPSAQTRRKLKQLAEDELMQHPMPRAKIIECVLDETTLFVGSTSKTHLGVVQELLKRLGVDLTFKTPWLDAGQEEELSNAVDLKEPGQSIWGCRFLRFLLNDADVMVEPESGSVKLVTHEGVKITLSGPVNNELDRMLENEAELLSAKIQVGTFAFTLDGLAYRISGFKLDANRTLHWTEQLEERMDVIKELWEWLDGKYRLFLETEDNG